MKVSLSSLNTILEQVEPESDIILSADRGDFQDAFKGDPYDYSYNSEEDVFTVIGLNSKRERLSDKKVARLEKSIGARLGSSSKAYDVLKKRMGKSDRTPTKKKKTVVSKCRFAVCSISLRFVINLGAWAKWQEI